MGVVAIYKSLNVLGNYHWRKVVGAALFLAGASVLAGQSLHYTWLSDLAPILASAVLIYAGVRAEQKPYLIGGSILGGAGAGAFLALWTFREAAITMRVGLLLAGLAAGFLGVSVVIWLMFNQFAWWPLVPFAGVASVGLPFLTGRLGIFDFELFLVTGTGVILLVIGVYKKLIGLIIPGSLLLGIGPGVGVPWAGAGVTHPLASTGMMLVCFAFGWGGITIFSRLSIDQFIWWPLIPCGILGMVGAGLYIGGNPGNAVNFIGNTTSIVMIIFGLYLLLLRRGIRY